MLLSGRIVGALPIAIGLSITCAALLAPAPVRAEPPERVVAITAEPHHKVRFDNGRVRLVEAVFLKGNASLFHTHLYDAFFVFFNTAAVGNQILGEKAVITKLAAGAVHFTSTAKGPYTHSVSAAGEETVHVSALELMQAPPPISAHTPQDRFPPFEVVIDNPRGRLFRLKLGPGEATESFVRPAATAILAVSSGRISEKATGRQDQLWDFEPGYFRWTETSEELTLRNESSTPIELVEIEVF
jgi:hypothetical protein